MFRLATEYTAAHMFTRLLAAIGGLMLVRLLPVNEYGVYTLVLAAFSFICTFSDMGATESLAYFRRRAGIRSRSWVHYFQAALRFRQAVFVFGFVASAAYVFFTARHIGENTQTILTAILLMGFAAWFAIQSGIIAYALKLEQRFRQAYAVEISNEAVKLFAIILIWFFGWVTSISGMTGIAAGALIAAILANSFLVHPLINTEKQKRQRVRRSGRILLGQIMPVLPGNIHFALQGPLITWLAAYYGSVINVAEVGALGRIGLLVSVIAGFTVTVFIPRLIAIKDGALFIKRYLQWWLVLIVFSGVMMLAIWTFPEALLFLLGDAYSGLNVELMVVAATAVIWSWNGYLYSVNRAMGWVRYQEYILFALIAGQVSMFAYLEFSTTLGVLYFGMGTALLWVTYQLVLNATGFMKMDKYDN